MDTLLERNNDLLNQLANDNASAFETLYHAYWKRLIQFVYKKTKNDELAKEIVQDLFVDIWERRHSLEITHLENYLFSSAKYKIIAHYKEKILDSIDDIEIEDFSTAYQIWVNDLQAQLNEAIEQLPDKTKTIFILNRIEGKSAKEISVLLNFPERTVEYHITQALRVLRSKLQEYYLLYIFFFLFK